MTTLLQGQMMEVPLTVSSLIAHAARHFGSTEIVSRRIEGDLHRYTIATAKKRCETTRSGALMDWHRAGRANRDPRMERLPASGR